MKCIRNSEWWYICYCKVYYQICHTLVADLIDYNVDKTREGERYENTLKFYEEHFKRKPEAPCWVHSTPCLFECNWKHFARKRRPGWFFITNFSRALPERLDRTLTWRILASIPGNIFCKLIEFSLPSPKVKERSSGTFSLFLCQLAFTWRHKHFWQFSKSMTSSEVMNIFMNEST